MFTPTADILSALNDPNTDLPALRMSDSTGVNMSTADLIYITKHDRCVHTALLEKLHARDHDRAKAEMDRAAMLAARLDDEGELEHFQEKSHNAEALAEYHHTIADEACKELLTAFRAEQDRRRENREKRARPSGTAEERAALAKQDGVVEPAAKRQKVE